MTMEELPRIKCVMHRSTLSCPFCLRPLKPPLYQCKGEHQLACADCRGERQCQKYDDDGGFNVCSTWADDFFTNMKADCPHEGCGLNVSYYNLDDHQSACPFAPCRCSVPGWGYKGPPPMHPPPQHRAPHARAQDPVRQGALAAGFGVGAVALAVSRGGWLCILLVGGALVMDAPIAVSVICIRAGASPPPYYAAKVWANGSSGAPNGRTDTVELEIKVTSSKEPGAVTVEELTFLTVLPTMLVGAGSSRMVSLHIHIDKLTS